MGAGAEKPFNEIEASCDWPLKDKRILFVVSRLTDGGAERRAALLSSELADHGYMVGMLIEKASEDEYPLSSSVQVLRIPKLSPFSKNPLKELPRQIKKMPARPRLMKGFTDVKSTCQNGDLFVMCSRSEAIPDVP